MENRAILARLSQKEPLMNILICSDDPQTARLLADAIVRESKATGLAQRQTVVTGAQACASLPLKGYDMAFLDIDLGGADGMDLARRLRAAREDAVIIFVSNHIEYAPAGYEVQAFRFLLKPGLDKQLPGVLALAIREFEKKHRSVSFTIESKYIDVPVKDILYLESSKKEIILHPLHDGRAGFRFYAGMAQMEERLAPLGFLRVHKSYLVNMAYVESFQYGKVRLHGGIILRSSEKSHAELKQRYMAWRGRHKLTLC